MILLNDFEALSLSLPDLGAADIDAIAGAATPTGARVVLGPGTGLGAAALIHADGRWIPVPGEGGHVDLGPITPRDMAIWPHLERVARADQRRGTVERSGTRAALSRRGGGRWALGEARHAGRCRECRPRARGPGGGEALTLFATYLGRYAGDLALVFMAHGGVYLAGGIPAKIAPALKSGAFRQAFEAKEPHREILAGMLTAIVIKPDAALAGIAAFARAPHRFGVELAGRRWSG